MTLEILNYGRYHTATGTLAEVVEALNAEGVPAHGVLVVSYDEDNNIYFAVYYK